MWKLIKMDLHRIFCSKALRVGAIMACVVSALYMLFSLAIVLLCGTAFQQDPMMAASMSSFVSQVAWVEGVDFSEVIFEGTGAFSLFIGCMITANFIGSEQSCGFAKNYAGQLNNKGYMAISKFLVTSAVQLLILVIYAIACAVFAKLLLGKYITGYEMSNFFAAFGLRALLHFAINAIIIFICTITKSHAIAMVVGSIFGIGVTKIVYLIVSMMLSMLKVDFNVANYMPDGIIGQLTIDSMESLCAKAIAISLGFIVVFVAANCYLLEKRDVK